MIEAVITNVTIPQIQTIREGIIVKMIKGNNRDCRLGMLIIAGVAAALLVSGTAFAAPSSSEGVTVQHPTDEPVFVARFGTASSADMSQSGEKEGLPRSAMSPVPALLDFARSGERPSIYRELAERHKYFKEINRVSTEMGAYIQMGMPSNSLLGDIGGWRSKLAQYGIGVKLLNVSVFQQNLRGVSHATPQLYGGQRPTVNNTILLTTLFDLGKIGIPGGQIVVGAMNRKSTWKANNPQEDFQIQRLEYNQKWFNDRIETQIGVYPMLYRFFGLFVGGQLAGNLYGPAGLLPLITGIPYLGVGSPGFNIKFKQPFAHGNFYNKFDWQQSYPQGGPASYENQPFMSFEWMPDNTGPLYLDEFGYERKHPLPGVPYIWARAGFLYNTASYKKFSGGIQSRNQLAYAAVDYQVLQFEDELPFDGIYLGASYFHTSKAVDAFSQSVLARAYVKGPFKSRPLDMASVIYTYAKYSSDRRDALRRAGVNELLATTTTYTLSYQARVMPGLAFLGSLTYATNPAVSPRLESPVNFSLTAIVNF